MTQAVFTDAFSNPLYTFEASQVGVRTTAKCRKCGTKTSVIADSFTLRNRIGRELTVLNINTCLRCGSQDTVA